LGTGAKLADFPGGDQFRALAMLKLYAVHNPVDHWHDSAVLPAQQKHDELGHELHTFTLLFLMQVSDLLAKFIHAFNLFSC